VIRALPVLLLALAAQAWSAEVRLRDDRGVEVALAQPAGRIVTVAPHLAEVAFAAGAGDRLVGVSAFSDHPPEAARLPVVSDATHVDFEALARLKPDLVLAWQSGNRARDFAQLEARGFRVFITEPTRPEDVARLVRTVGRLAGTESTAEAQARAIEARLASLRGRFAGRPEVRVFVEIWNEPLMTVNARHVITALVELCGGRNVFAAAGPLTPVISREQVLAADPDAILVSAAPSLVQGRLDSWRRWQTLRAVRRGDVYAMDAGLLNRMGPRLLDGAEALCSVLERARASPR
jgi:iron complex transport system substrate-binding protein